VNELWTRRLFVQAALASGAGVSLTRLAIAGVDPVAKTPLAERSLELRNTHNGEVVNVVYRRGDVYDTAAIASLRHIMRDYRNDDAHDIDLALYDQLHELAIAAKRDPRYDIISGYRSPATNAKLAAASKNVARKSLHLQGRAIDLRLHGCSCADLRDLALAAGKGGVGYYKRSDFVHVDTGRFRTWAG
jgi:uncharacterized protein YcbK (DUF882 family)